MYDKVIEILDGLTSGEHAYAELLERWSIDRWFTFPGMLKSCEHTVSRLREYGLADAQVETFPADGRTMVGHWKMPLAWDAKAATLTVVEPVRQAGRVLCEYRAIPCSLAMWSAATPAAGITAEVVAVPTIGGCADFSGLDVAGRIVLTDLRGNAVRNEAIRRNAAGVLSDHCRHPLAMPDAVDWMNAWSEDPQGWGLKEGESNTWGFTISHRRGRELRAWLAQGTVRLSARVDTRIYEGVMPVATGLLPGTSDEEVLVLGHGAEQGANDNASGCAVMLEALRVLRAAVDSGALEPPRRSIRALVSWEIYGTQAFYAAHVSRFEKTVAGLCLDMVGEDQGATSSYTILHRDPHSMLSFADSLAHALCREIWSARHPRYAWAMSEFDMTDNITADPVIGVPTPYIGAEARTDRTWHTSEDTPDKVSVGTLKMMATYAATYLYVLATAGLDEARALAHLMAAEARAEAQQAVLSGVSSVLGATDVRRAGEAARAAERGAIYLGEIHTRALGTLQRLVTDEQRAALALVVERCRGSLRGFIEEQVDLLWGLLEEKHGGRRTALVAEAGGRDDREAERLVVSRLSFGALSADFVPLDKRGELSIDRFGGPLYILLTWCDGTRTLADAARLARAETGQELHGYLQQVRRLEELGMVRISPATP